MLGFGSISESAISSFSAIGNFGRIRTLIRVVSTAFGRVLVTGSGSGIIRIGSGTSGARETYKLYATQTPYVYISQDVNGNRFFVTINPDTKEAVDSQGNKLTAIMAPDTAPVITNSNKLLAEQSSDMKPTNMSQAGRRASIDPDIYVESINKTKFRV